VLTEIKIKPTLTKHVKIQKFISKHRSVTFAFDEIAYTSLKSTFSEQQFRR